MQRRPLGQTKEERPPVMQHRRPPNQALLAKGHRLMPTIIASRPTGVNHQAAPRPRLPLDMRLRYKRRTLNPLLANTDRPCFPDPSRWDDNVDQDKTRALCKGCPLAVACGTAALIDEAFVLIDKGSTALHAVVSGTRGGVTARARRPAVRDLADRIITDRMERAERARIEAERKRAEAEAAKAGAAA